MTGQQLLEVDTAANRAMRVYFEERTASGEKRRKRGGKEPTSVPSMLTAEL